MAGQKPNHLPCGVTDLSPTSKRKQTHTQPKSLEYVDLDIPARLRVGHMMSLFGVSHSTLYKRKKAGALPQPDGDDGRPYWLTTSVRPLLVVTPKSLGVD